MTKRKAFKAIAFTLTPLVFLDELATGLWRGVLHAFNETRGHIVDTWNA